MHCRCITCGVIWKNCESLMPRKFLLDLLHDHRDPMILIFVSIMSWEINWMYTSNLLLCDWWTLLGPWGPIVYIESIVILLSANANLWLGVPFLVSLLDDYGATVRLTEMNCKEYLEQHESSSSAGSTLVRFFFPPSLKVCLS